MTRGKIRTVQLSEHMMAGRDQWLKWHERYSNILSPQLEQVQHKPLSNTHSCSQSCHCTLNVLECSCCSCTKPQGAIWPNSRPEGL